ncbi:hypothetical protein, partial [Methylobacterium crusticola]|uniref:hypothetical protein n=1 Tax=Methylobacterium crusticola TaxID=1697972 RepID=UPI001EE2A941
MVKGSYSSEVVSDASVPPVGRGKAPLAAMLAISGSVDTPNTGPALDDLWKVLRTLAAEGLTDTERDVA